ncbi:hypothetical protein Vretimale_16514 [Volvox reticuliferus]|uniref:Formyl transferase C-terminal domain-containing protein n=1 Tax=Volvox reticuliferus TaxID=1737510 RepID=A0A8J4CFV4_9CHLO|nr:hypothetical protein Vretifemale_8701 [Volvox reticuliferus]GIM13356.1 hypothetical protein Vretimale_16514 [Volvox reticuliferus]
MPPYHPVLLVPRLSAHAEFTSYSSIIRLWGLQYFCYYYILPHIRTLPPPLLLVGPTTYIIFEPLVLLAPTPSRDILYCITHSGPQPSQPPAHSIRSETRLKPCTHNGTFGQLTREEAHLDFFSAPAAVLHNRVRAFAGWPGTSATFLVQDEATGVAEPMVLKIVKTRWTESPIQSCSASTSAPSGVTEADSRAAEGGSAAAVLFVGDVMSVPCAGGTSLEVLQVQPPTKKVMPVQDFKNGLRGKRLLLPMPMPGL